MKKFLIIFLILILASCNENQNKNDTTNNDDAIDNVNNAIVEDSELKEVIKLSKTNLKIGEAVFYNDSQNTISLVDSHDGFLYGVNTVYKMNSGMELDYDNFFLKIDETSKEVIETILLPKIQMSAGDYVRISKDKYLYACTIDDTETDNLILADFSDASAEIIYSWKHSGGLANIQVIDEDNVLLGYYTETEKTTQYFFDIYNLSFGTAENITFSSYDVEAGEGDVYYRGFYDEKNILHVYNYSLLNGEVDFKISLFEDGNKIEEYSLAGIESFLDITKYEEGNLTAFDMLKDIYLYKNRYILITKTGRIRILEKNETELKSIDVPEDFDIPNNQSVTTQRFLKGGYLAALSRAEVGKVYFYNIDKNQFYESEFKFMNSLREGFMNLGFNVSDNGKLTVMTTNLLGFGIQGTGNADVKEYFFQFDIKELAEN